MTTAELIEKLKTLPQDAPVIYRCCSDWAEMDLDDVGVITAEDSKRINQQESINYTDRTWPVHSGAAVVRRGGRFCNAYPENQYPKGEEPEYITVVTFPGN